MKWINIIGSIILALSVFVFVAFNIKQKSSIDTEGPIIKMDTEEIVISVKDSEEVLLKGISAQDSRDGDVTESLTVEGLSDFREGKRVAVIAAYDHDNHVEKVKRTVKYSDYVPIHYVIRRPLRFEPSDKEIDILSIVHAQDCLDGDVSKKILFNAEEEIFMTKPGNYKVLFTVTNSAGDTADLPVTVTIYNKAVEENSPQIHLSNYLVYVKKGGAIRPADYIEGVTYRGINFEVTDEAGDFPPEAGEILQPKVGEEANHPYMVARNLFKINNQVDYNMPGTYEIEYSIADKEGNSGSVLLTVVVEGE